MKFSLKSGEWSRSFANLVLNASRKPPKKKAKTSGKAIKKGEWKELTPEKILKKAKALTEKTGTILKTFKPNRGK